MKRMLIPAAALIAVSLRLAEAAPIEIVTARPTNTDIIDWAQLGGDRTRLTGAQNVISSDGVSATLDLADEEGRVYSQCPGVPGRATQRREAPLKQREPSSPQSRPRLRTRVSLE